VEEARADGYERGHDDGYDDGYDAAESALQAEWEDARAALIDDTTRFEEAWAQYVEANETRFVELALTLAEAIVDAPLSDEVRAASETALADAVAELASTPPVTVTVHPVDYQRLQESGVAERLINAHDDVQLESDPERPEGDWDVSSPTGVVRRRRSEVIATLRDRLGLPASGPDSS
jgi:flagellar assembly protein FliH